MYCKYCGKEVDGKYCKYCGKEIEKKQGMKYFDFFWKYYLVFIIILNIVLLYTRYINIKEYEAIDASLLYLEIIINLAIYILIPIPLREQMEKRTGTGFILLIGFLTADYIWRVITTTATTYFSYPQEDLGLMLIITILIYAIWYVPNFIYFIKRRKLFVN